MAVFSFLFFQALQHHFSPSLIVSQFFKKMCHSLLSISGINIYWRQLEEERAYFIYTSIPQPITEGQELRQGPRGRNREEFMEGKLLTVLLPIACSATHNSEPPPQGMGLQWAGAFLVNHLSWKHPQRLPIRQFEGGILSVEALST